jgi:glycosyltransferase involved in cell wall biosynthesis
VSLFQPNNINSIVRISSFDQIWFQRGLLSKSLSKIYDYIVLNKCDQIWSTSNFISRYIDKKFNKKIVYTPPFINYSTKYKLKKTLQKIKNRNFLLFIGTISERKGVHLLKELFLEIYKRDKKYKFVIIGRDTKNYFTSTYRKYFDNQTFSKNCIYFKVKKKKFFFPLIKYADAVIIPSLVETSPNILQEVLINNGIPICSNNTSMEELLKNDQNFLFKNNDVDDLVKKTLKLLLNDKNKLLKKIKVFKKMLYAKERQEIILKNLSVLLK